MEIGAAENIGVSSRPALLLPCTLSMIATGASMSPFCVVSVNLGRLLLNVEYDSVGDGGSSCTYSEVSVIVVKILHLT